MSSRMPKNTSSSSGVRSSISKRLRSPIGSMLWRTSVMVDGIGSRARERGYLSRRLLSGLAVALLRGLAGRAERRGEEDRKSVVSGKSVSVRVERGGRRSLQKKKDRITDDKGVTSKHK